MIMGLFQMLPCTPWQVLHLGFFLRVFIIFQPSLVANKMFSAHLQTVILLNHFSPKTQTKKRQGNREREKLL